MKKATIKALANLALAAWCFTASAVDRFVSLSGGHVAPFTTWADAATNIQAAIDVASGSETVWVTNGIYNTGGKAMAGDLTNRVVLDKALTVRSVNGPTTTTIQGMSAAAGPAAIRCAWLTNGSALVGFTIRNGATRSVGDNATLRTGGGVWASSTNARIANCIVVSNAAAYMGGGVYQGTVVNCLLTGNTATGGGGAYASRLNNCTVTSNSVGGFYGVSLTNCIVYFNATYNWAAASGSVISYSCTAPQPPGAGNTGADPQLIDGIHVANTSPCRSAGTNAVSGEDLDGQPWENPPTIGCDQWRPELLVLKPRVQFINDPPGFTVSVIVAGAEPFTCWWTRDGVPIEDDGHYGSARTANLMANGIKAFDIGGYQVMVSNAFGMVTSAVTQLPVHCVGAAGSGPVPPYSSWATAATNIQDAINVALPGELVLVTNGVYAFGGKVMGGDLTNRVALDKALMVVSANGPAVTTIQGGTSPGTNGPLAIRCAWLTNGATLSGFTLRHGATRALSASPDQQMNGGGVWGASSNALVSNCVITTNSAAYGGGGAYQVTLKQCTLIGNRCPGTGTPGSAVGRSGEGGGVGLCVLENCVLTANFANNAGGGASGSILRNCAATGNWGISFGGGVDGGILINCTVVSNSVGFSDPFRIISGNGGGVARANLTNCILYQNFRRSFSNTDSNHYLCNFSFSCSSPLPAGTGNTAADPQLLGDGVHLSVGSPCRAAGTSSFLTGMDIDGQAWANPPAMGCDEWLPNPVIASQPRAWIAGRPVNLNIGGVIAAGQEPFTFAWVKDGTVLDDDAHYDSTGTTNLVAKNFSLTDVGGYQIVVSNSFGQATSSVFQVVVHCVNGANPNPALPYTNWVTAAANIQDAIDVASDGEFVLVTNGTYATGGRAIEGDLTNRVSLTGKQTVLSVNGPTATFIHGAWDPTTTNGPLAIRCAWLADGATLDGFTLQGGATLATGSSPTVQSGGGVLAMANTCVVAHCVISNNSAMLGGGCYQGMVLNCFVVENLSHASGGGAALAKLVNCFVGGNATRFYGGGTYFSSLVNCTVTKNLAGSLGGGINSRSGDTIRNCVVYFNSSVSQSNWGSLGGPALDFSYSCTTPMPSAPGAGNTTADPQFVDDFHLATTSPCRATGNLNYVSATDIEGETWLIPPAIGCDEVVESTLVGPLSVSIEASQTTVLANHSLTVIGHITGRSSRLEWSFGEGPTVTNASYITTHAWTDSGDYPVTFTAFNSDNPGGVSTNILVHVIPLETPVLTSLGLSGTNFQFQFSTQTGASNTVEYAMNLNPPIAWTLLRSLVSTGAVMSVTDFTATNDTRFYRVRSQ